MSPLQHHLEEQYHPQQKLFLQGNNQHGLVSFLSTRFIHAVAYAQITRQEAMVLVLLLIWFLLWEKKIITIAARC